MKMKWQILVAGIATMSWIVQASSTTVVAWGDNSYGQLQNVPTGPSNFVAIAQGGMNGLAINSNGMVVAWGNSSVPASLSNVVAIASGLGNELALKGDSTVVAWGTRTQPPAGLSNVIAIAAGYYHDLALKSDGTVVAWGGSDNFGEIDVPPGLSNVTAVAAGYRNSVALLNSGNVVVWGNNLYGQTNVPASASNVLAIAAGLDVIMALRADGRVVAWGYNGYNEVNVPTGLSNVVAIAASQGIGLALKRDGTLAQWGFNFYNTPGGLTNVVAIAACENNYSALKGDGTPWIVKPPASQLVYSGTSVTLNILATGTTNISYQWCFNGANMTGATNTFLLLTNMQTTNSGNYTVTLSNAVGMVISSNAVLTVSNSPPIISPFTSQLIVALHSNALINATIAGSYPQSYQWQFNGTNLIGATNVFLSLTNAQLTNSGNYSIIVSNAYGSATGLVDTLTVMDLGAALNATNLVWTTSSNYPWFPETSTNHDGVAAAQSATTPWTQVSLLQTTVTGPGTLTFWEKCSQFSDMYVFSTTGNNGQTTFLPPFAQWWQETIYLGAGTQTLQWDFQPSTSPDAAWLDQVNFVAGATPATITGIASNQIVQIGSNVTFSVYAIGTPPLSCQWTFNGNPLLGATNFSLSLTNVQLTNAGIYSVTVTNAYGSPATTNATLMVQMPRFDTSAGNMFMNSQGFNFQLGGLTGHGQVIIFASTDLLNWLPIFTNPPTVNVIQILDTNALYQPFRFYRAAEQ